MDGSLNFLRRMKDRDAKRHARRRAAKRSSRWPWAGEKGRAKHRLVLGFAALFLAGIVVAVIAATPTLSNFRVVSPAYAPQVRNGRYQKGVNVTFGWTVTDATTPHAAPPINEVSLLQSDTGTVQQTYDASGVAASPYNYTTLGMTPSRQDNYTAQLRVQGGHANDGTATSTLSFPVGFTPEILDVQVNPVIGTEDSVYEFFIKIRDYDGEPLQDGYPRIWIRNPATGQLVNLGGAQDFAVMVPFEVDGTTLGETYIGRNLDPESLTPSHYMEGVWYRYAIPGPAIGEQLGILPRLPNPGTGTGHGFYEFLIAYRDVDGVPNQGSARTVLNQNLESVFPGSGSDGKGPQAMPGGGITAATWQRGPQIFLMDFGRNHFFPCDEAGSPDTNGYLDTQGRNPGMFNEGGVTVLPRDPQHDRQGTGSSTFIFRVRNRQSLNFGAVDQTLNFPAQGTPSPNRILSWQNARYDTWRNILTSAVYPNASGTPSPLVIRFDEDGDGDPSDGTPHFMQMTWQLGNTDAVWTYVVQPTDQMAVNGGVGGPFTNGGRGKTWDNNFECFLYGPLVDPALFGAMTIDPNNPFGAALPTVARQVFSPGRLKFQYEISRDIVCWSKRTRLTTDPNSDNPDTPFDTADTAFPRGVRHPITFDVKKMISTDPGDATTGPSGRPYPAPPGPRTTWVSYTGIDGEQSHVGDLDPRLDTLKVDPVLRVEERTRPDTYREIISLTTYAAETHRTFDPSKDPTDPNYTFGSPIQIVDDYRTHFNKARQTTAYKWPFRIQYIHSGLPADSQDIPRPDGAPPKRLQVHVLRKTGSGPGSYTPVSGSPFNLLEEDSSDQNFTDGKWYHLEMSFSPGIYRYYYEASDGVRTTQWPGQAHSETDPGTSLAALNAERSINTFRVNHAPVLSNPSVTPGTGPEDGQFTFEVTYQDQDGDQPLKPWLYIEQPAGSKQYRRVTMVPKNPVTWPTTQPVVYKYDTGTDFQLTQGMHQHYFAFVDNWNTAAEAVDGECTLLPATGRGKPFDGPNVVVNRPPQLSGGTVTDAAGKTSGTTATPFFYKVNYLDANNQAPLLMQVMVDPVIKDELTTTVQGALVGPRAFNVADATGVQRGWMARFTSGGAAKRWYYVTDVQGSTVTISPGFDLYDPNGDNDTSDAVKDGDRVVFQTIEANGRTFSMSKVTESDKTYLDGVDYVYPGPNEPAFRLSEGPHTFLFLASDGFSTVVDSTHLTADIEDRVKPKSGPVVTANTSPILALANVTYDGQADPVSARTRTTITVPTRVAVEADEWKGHIIEVLTDSAATPAERRLLSVRCSLEIRGNTAATAGGTTELTVTGDPIAANVQAGGAGDVFRIGRLLLAPDVGPRGTTFRWRVQYVDADNDSPLAGDPASLRLVIDNDPVWSAANITRIQVDPTDQNFADGVIFEFSTAALDSGFHVYHFEAHDGANATSLMGAGGGYAGPLVNNAPVLSDGSVSPTAGTEVNMYRFEVRYTDADNDAPTDGYPKLRVWGPDGELLPGAPFTMTAIDTNPFDTGRVYRYDLQKESPGLVSGAYSYEFEVESSNGAHRVTLGRLPGPYINRAPKLSGQKVEPAAGSRADTYTYSVKYEDPKVDPMDDTGNPPAANNPVLKIYLPASAGGGLVGTYVMTPKAGSNGKYTPEDGGEVYEYTVPKDFFNAAGEYSFTIEARDNPGPNYLALDAEPVSGTGPAIADAPVLSEAYVNGRASSENPTSIQPILPGDKVTLRVKYTDANGEAPTQIRAVVYRNPADPMPLHTLNMTAESATDPDAIRNGVFYTASISSLPLGLYEYYFEASDGRDAVEYPQGAAADASKRFKDLVVNTPPVLTDAKVEPQSGQPSDADGGTPFTWSVRYADVDGHEPTTAPLNPAGQGNTIRVHLYAPNSATPGLQLVATPTSADPVQGGRVYQVQLPINEADAPLGKWAWYVEFHDGIQRHVWPAGADQDRSRAMQGPDVQKIETPPVYLPELTGLKVVPETGLVGRGFEFSVMYRHQGQKLPKKNELVLLVSKALDGGGTQQLGPYSMRTTEVDTTRLANGGWKYTAIVPVNETGTYSYSVEVEDEDGGKATAGPAQFEVTPPLLTEPSVSPATGGYAGGIFTFSVKYTTGANKAPEYVQLVLTNPDGQDEKPVEMTPVAEGDYVTGKVYTKSLPLTAQGEYSFVFKAKEGSVIVTSGDPSKVVVGEPAPPVLEGEQVTEAGGDRFTYRVTYKQAQNLPPAWVRLEIALQGKPETARVVDMVRESPSSASYAGGVVYTYTTPDPLSPGQYTYRITASNGFAEAEMAGEAPLINTPPTLSGWKLSPERGDENTRFTFEVIYTDADNQPPATYTGSDGKQYPSVWVSVGNTLYPLKQADPNDTNYADGALYRVDEMTLDEMTLPAGDLGHSFIASDGHATVRAPASGVVPGPKVLPATKVSMHLSRASVTLDAQTAVTLNGALEPVVPNASVTVTFGVLVEGASPNDVTEETRQTVEVRTDSEGRFSASVVPDQDGTWVVRASYAGDLAEGGSRGSGLGEAQFTVDPARYTLMPGRHMMGVPTTFTGALQDAIAGGEFQTAHYTGDVAVPYLYGPDAALPLPVPGSGFWLRAKATLQVTAKGRVVDHSAPVTLAIRPGWQIISNPYLLPIDWQATQVRVGGQTLPLMEAGEWVSPFAWTWDPVRGDWRLLHGGYGGLFAQTDRELQPWQGAFVFSRVAGELILAAPSANRAAREDARAMRSRHRASEREWSIQLRASNGREVDEFNYAGVTAQGRAATHARISTPPRLAGYVDLYFQSTGSSTRYATDFRSPVAGEQTWDFTVETDVLDRPVTVSAPDLSRIPKTLEVLLEDVDAGGKRTYLRTSGGYTFNPGESGTRQMRLIVRPRAQGALRVVQVDVTPTRGGRAFNVTLSQDALVSVAILSPSGQEVAVVADNKATSECRATLFWDETRKDGARLPGGVYLVQVTATLPEGQVARSVRMLVLTR